MRMCVVCAYSTCLCVGFGKLTLNSSAYKILVIIKVSLLFPNILANLNVNLTQVYYLFQDN